MQRRLMAGLLVVSMLGCQGVGPQSADAPQSKQMSVNGTTLHYVEQGRGTPVVMVHGAFSDARNWDGIRPIVAQRYRVITPSLRYHYPNTWEDDGARYSLAQHVEDLAAFIRGLDAGKVHLAANSMGSRIVGNVALKYPELVRSMVLGDPFIVVPTSAEAKSAIADWQKDASQSVAAARNGDMKLSAQLLYNAVLADPQAFGKAPQSVQQLVLDNARSMGPYSRQPAAAPVSCEQVSALRIPTLVINGENSRAIFGHGAAMMMTCLGNSGRLVKLPGARHNWFATHPEAGAKAILEFIDRQQ